MSDQDILDVLVSVVGNEHLVKDDNAIIIPLDSTSQDSQNINNKELQTLKIGLSYLVNFRFSTKFHYSSFTATIHQASPSTLASINAA